MGLSLYIFEKNQERVEKIKENSVKIKILKNELENPSQELASNFHLFKSKEKELIDLEISDFSDNWKELGYLRNPQVDNLNYLLSFVEMFSDQGYVIQNEMIELLLSRIQGSEDLKNFIRKSFDKILLISP